MLKRLAEIFSSFFGSLFGGKKKPQPASAHDKAPGMIEDSSDVPEEEAVVINVIDVDIPVPGNDPGPFADGDKEAAIETMPSTEPAPAPDPSDDAPTDTDTGTPDSDDAPEPPTTHTPRFLWCLDNGHGKLQPGKRSPIWKEGEVDKQFFEYEFNRDVVERIKKGLKEKGVRFFDLVPDFLEVGSFLKERVERANKRESDLPKLYVSVHSNAGPAAVGKWVSPSIKGAEVWFAKNSKKGKKMAAVFQKHILHQTGFKDRKLKSTQIKNLYVLAKTSMPAILTENGFYNNKTEVLELMKDSVRQKIADAHIAAILEIEKNGL